MIFAKNIGNNNLNESYLKAISQQSLRARGPIISIILMIKIMIGCFRVHMEDLIYSSITFVPPAYQ